MAPRRNIIFTWHHGLFPLRSGGQLAHVFPHLGLRAELFVEVANRAGAAYVMGHQYIRLDPNVVVGGYFGPVARLGDDLFSQSHWFRNLKHVSSLSKNDKQNKKRFIMYSLHFLGTTYAATKYLPEQL